LFGVGYKSMYWHSVSFCVCLESDISPCVGILFPFCCQESGVSPWIGIPFPVECFF
jgi:hypothetical protein